MGDQEGKIKNQYISWSPEETKTLLRLLVDGVNQNWTDASGKFNKLTVEQRILPELNKICGSKKTFSQYKNKTKILKKKHKGFVDLLRFSSGFGWDKDTKKFTTPNEVWNEYLQVDNLLKVMMHDLLTQIFLFYLITTFFIHNRDTRKIRIYVTIRLKILKT